MDLRGRTVVVIGGTSGIGLATARQALEAGARVVVAGRDAQRLADASVAVPGVIAVQADVMDGDALDACYAAAGTVDHLVQAASNITGGRIADTPEEQLRPGVEVRLWGSVRAVQHVLPHLAADGSITLVSGGVSSRPVPGTMSGAAGAGAVEAMARALAVELAPVRVNTVCPGMIATPMLDRIFGDQRDARFAAVAGRLPVGRIGAPEDVASAILLLAPNPTIPGVVLLFAGGERLV